MAPYTECDLYNICSEAETIYALLREGNAKIKRAITYLETARY